MEDVDVAKTTVESPENEKPRESPKLGPVLEFPKSGTLRPPPPEVRAEVKLEFPKSGPLKPPVLGDKTEVQQSLSMIEHETHTLSKPSN